MVVIFSQTYPPATEIWSEPVRVDSLDDKFISEGYPSLPNDFTKLILQKATMVSVSYKIDTLWSLPLPLNNNINNGSPVRNPNINRYGNRLFFCRWGGYGGWDLWYCEWDTTLNDWGPSVNLGPSINGPGVDYFAYELSKDTLYCINNRWASLGICIYVKNSISNQWEIIDSSDYNHPFGMGNIRGLSITGDRRKAYFSRYITLSSASLQSELYVTFWDTLNSRWGEVFELNINSHAYQPDTTNNFYWIGGWDEYPWISPNGKLLFFHSNRDVAREDTITAPDIYMSVLLIDENGNPVSVKDLPDIKSIIKDFLLLQNYPNPFNSTTNIRFYLPVSDKVSLTVFDILGKEIAKPINNKTINAGWHEYKLSIDSSGIGNLHQISSGIYIYRLETSTGAISKKLIVMK